MNLKPFFSYYGGKWRAAPHYPKPTCDTIIEPFAGSAGYSIRYPHKNVVLFDKDEKICGVWDYLINATDRDVDSLPEIVGSVDDVKACQEAKWLIGFWLNKGAATPCKTASKWMRSNIRPNSYWGKVIKDRIITQRPFISHWQVFNTPFESLGNEDATWFIDPPYQAAGKFYRHGSRDVDFTGLADFCKSRIGQVIVCENQGADWLPFCEFRDIKSSPGHRRSQVSKEVIWVKEKEDWY